MEDNDKKFLTGYLERCLDVVPANVNAMGPENGHGHSYALGLLTQQIAQVIDFLAGARQTLYHPLTDNPPFNE